MLKEPATSQLRTKEQLGYIVSAMFTNYKGVIGGMIKVQSNKNNPEFLENRINEFVKNIREKGSFEWETVKKVKEGIIKNMKQVKLNFLEEANESWK